MKFLHPSYIVFIFIIIFLSGCNQENAPHGVVATVNGEPITLHTVQTLLDSRSSALRLQSGSTFDEMRAEYGKALSTLITGALVRQELEAKALAPSENDINQAIERIISDYGQENLLEVLDEAYLRPEDWYQLMRDHLALEIFRNQVLLPGIKIEFNEAKNYYKDHKSEFTLPETVKTCFLAAEARETLVEWCKQVGKHDFVNDAVAQCVEVPLSEIPQPWNRELKSLANNTCGKIREEEGEWQAVALLEHNRPRVPELSEVYALVEKILLEPKQTAAFEQWLEKKLENSKIFIAPELQECLVLQTDVQQNMKK